ncbi:hypothetical protein EYF80_068356 [Liparis tanakae]|uniref:Uncharacterized protein n=1 Tax=Liparis tanakae TaxID=230148 RepID=A0A4Z2DYB9_9TELE|nr:hypothetical protein EYF80_068356 [Liparis tanakae]
MVLNSLPVKLPVRVPQPAERGFVLAGQPVVEVDQRVVTLHVLVQSSFEIPETRHLHITKSHGATLEVTCSASLRTPCALLLLQCSVSQRSRYAPLSIIHADVEAHSHRLVWG